MTARAPKRVQAEPGKAAGKKSPPKQGAALTKHEVRRIEAERRMLDAAVDILAEHGVDGLTLADVGNAAGYSRGLPAHYFGNKAGLLEAVAKHVVAKFVSGLAALPPSKTGMTSLLQFVRAFLDLDARQRGGRAAINAVLGETLTEPSLALAVASLNDASVTAIAGWLKDAAAAGEIRADVDVRRQAIMILGTLVAIEALWLVDPRSVPVESVVETLVASLRRELAA